MANAIISPTFEINGKPIPIVPESVQSRIGTGTSVCVAQSVGSFVEPVHKVNLTEAFGYVTVRIENVVENIQAIQDAIEAGSDNTVVFYDSKTGYTSTMNNARISNEIERTFSSDGDGTIEFCGAQILQTFGNN